MSKELIILIAEDDDGHARLVEKNLMRQGLKNRLIRFENGQQTLDFLFQNRRNVRQNSEVSYLLLLDIHMPKVDGIEVLRQIKQSDSLKKLPVIMLTTTDDPREVDSCYAFGCNTYLVKPVDYDKFVETVRNLGLFISLVEFPEIASTE